jgi:tetratricopeptide (TPR) repeat protein
MQTKVTTTERSPILTRLSESNPKTPMPLGIEASFTRTKVTMSGRSLILTRRSDSIPKAPSRFRNRGDAYMNKGDYDRALADYNEAIRLDPNNARPSPPAVKRTT